MRQRSFRSGRLSEQVADELENLIPEEFPEPGHRWPVEAELADRFRVSRIVIREAVKLLEERGLVEVKAGRGTTTQTPSGDRVKSSLLRLFRNRPVPKLDDMEKMLEVREALEQTAAGLAAVRRTDDDLLDMEKALAKLSDVRADIRQRIDSDLQFHLSVARAAHNRFLEMVVGPLTDVFLQQISLTDTFSVGLDQHRQIFDQIRAENPVGAREAVRRLLRSTKADVRRAVALITASRNGQAIPST